MEVIKKDLVHGSTLETKNLLNYLSKIVKINTEEELRRKKKLVEFKREKLRDLKGRIKQVKTTLTSSLDEHKKLQTIERCLKLIETLKREGVLIGDNRKIVAEALWTINELNFQQLRELEERLFLYLPDQFTRQPIT